MQFSLFDYSARMKKIDSTKDTLSFLNEIIDWELFHPTLTDIRNKDRKNKSGRKPFDVVFMFKILVIKSLYNLSHDEIEFQILDRLSFMRFLNIGTTDKVPDSKTIWLFQDQLTELKLIKPLFRKFDKYLRDSGFTARNGQMIDASFVNVPIQRNSRDENTLIKSGETPPEWKGDDEQKKHKLAQKDIDARWNVKNGKRYFGYKNHIEVDVANKFIRDYTTTDASVHDSNVFEEIFDSNNESPLVYADSAYSSKGKRAMMKEKGFVDKVIRKAYRNKKLSNEDVEWNKKISKVRGRVEHVFGVQFQMAHGSRILRTIGFAKAHTQIGLRNLVYNMMRFKYLKTI